MRAAPSWEYPGLHLSLIPYLTFEKYILSFGILGLKNICRDILVQKIATPLDIRLYVIKLEETWNREFCYQERTIAGASSPHWNQQSCYRHYVDTAAVDKYWQWLLLLTKVPKCRLIINLTVARMVQKGVYNNNCRWHDLRTKRHRWNAIDCNVNRHNATGNKPTDKIPVYNMPPSEMPRAKMPMWTKCQYPKCQYPPYVQFLHN